MLKIMLVDDEKFAVDGLKKLLNWDYFEGELVGTASSGEEAVSLFDRLLPDVVISDIKMGAMTGIELAKIIHERKDSTRMILLTAHGEFEYARQAIQYGVVDYILKPITIEKIENLSERLAHINLLKEQQHNSYLMAWDDQLKDQILNALRNSDPKILDDFFQSGLFGELMAGGACNTVGIQLLDYLYQYLNEISVNPHTLNYSRKETISTFLGTRGYQAKMDFIITKYYDLLTSGAQEAPSHSIAIVSYAMEHIKEHFSEPEFNLSGLAYAMNVSLSHSSTVFKRATGNNLSTYVTDLRLDKAKTLLSDYKYSIMDIVGLSGYNDAKYFAKLLKIYTGRTPGEYRDLFIQGGGKHGI